MRVAMVDPSLFTLPYDVALAGGLERAGAAVTLHGRALVASDGEACAVTVQPSFYRVAGGALARRLPKAMRLAIKGVDHAVSMVRLRRVLEREKPDVIHFQWLPLPLLDARLLPGLRRVAPIVLTVHDTDPFNGVPTARLQRLGFVASLNGCERLVVHTAQGVARLAALGVDPARIAQLPHGPLAERPAGAGAPDTMMGPITFVLFGKIKSYKGADLLIEAFARLPQSVRSQARVRIIGQAYMDVDALVRLARKLNVASLVTIEPRFVADDEMATVFAPGCVAVFPYREIEASGVLSIALAHGRPVLASNLGSFAETLRNGVQGRLLPPGDIDALSEAMRQVVEDRSLAAGYAGAAGALAASLPGWDEIARLTLAVYRDARHASAVRRPAQVAELGEVAG